MEKRIKKFWLLVLFFILCLGLLFAFSIITLKEINFDNLWWEIPFSIILTLILFMLLNIENDKEEIMPSNRPPNRKKHSKFSKFLVTVRYLYGYKS